jgi:ribosomal protein S18 acetylase RimI-like enzyme
MAAEIKIRPATLIDLDFVQQDGYIPDNIAERKIEWKEVFVAEKDGSPVSYLRLEYLWSRLPYISMIHVIPQHRHQGVGSAMLQFVEGFLLDRGQTMLYSSSQANEPEAQAWHRHMGFEECGIITGINAGDVGEVFFRKRLY